MLTRTLAHTGFIALGVIMLTTYGSSVAAAEATVQTVQAALDVAIVPSDLVLEEVRRFADSRVPAVTRAATAQEWEKITQRHGREKLLPWLKEFNAGFAGSEPGSVAAK